MQTVEVRLGSEVTPGGVYGRAAGLGRIADDTVYGAEDAITAVGDASRRFGTADGSCSRADSIQEEGPPAARREPENFASQCHHGVRIRPPIQPAKKYAILSQ